LQASNKSIDLESENKPEKENESESEINEIYLTSNSIDSWYKDLKFFLTHGFSPQHYEPKKREHYD
jgi:hypothetical protein